jgi:hypothetical protein
LYSLLLTTQLFFFPIDRLNLSLQAGLTIYTFEYDVAPVFVRSSGHQSQSREHDTEYQDQGSKTLTK